MSIPEKAVTCTKEGRRKTIYFRSTFGISDILQSIYNTILLTDTRKRHRALLFCLEGIFTGASKGREMEGVEREICRSISQCNLYRLRTYVLYPGVLCILTLFVAASDVSTPTSRLRDPESTCELTSSLSFASGHVRAIADQMAFCCQRFRRGFLINYAPLISTYNESSHTSIDKGRSRLCYIIIYG